MPRHTHPQPRQGHSRAHVRFQRDRFVRRRWQQAKDRYARLENLHPDEARLNPTHEDAWWPFTLPSGQFARNPFNLCSCSMCTLQDDDRRHERRRARQQWEREETARLAEPDELDRQRGPVLHGRHHTRRRAQQLGGW